MPSANFVAREFNLRASSSEGITPESARRWLKGLAVPGIDKLLVIQSWLSLDLNALMMPSVEPTLQKDSKLRGGALAEQEEFIRATQAIQDGLQALIGEVDHLKKKMRGKWV